MDTKSTFEDKSRSSYPILFCCSFYNSSLYIFESDGTIPIKDDLGQVQLVWLSQFWLATVLASRCKCLCALSLMVCPD